MNPENHVPEYRPVRNSAPDSTVNPHSLREDPVVSHMVWNHRINRPLLLLVAIVVVLASGCKSGRRKQFYNDKKQLVLEDYHQEDRIKSRLTYFNDSRTDYLFESWSAEGKLTDSSYYRNDTIEGLHKFYEAKSKLMHYETYGKGLLHGLNKAVYENGIASFEGYRIKGNKVGEWKFCYENGLPITYEYYDSLGSLKYFRKYNDKGELIKFNGNAIIAIYFPDTVSAGDTVSGRVEVAIPPRCRVKLDISGASGQAVGSPLHNSEVTIPVNPFRWYFDKAGLQKLAFSLFIQEQGGSSETSEHFHNVFVK